MAPSLSFQAHRATARRGRTALLKAIRKHSAYPLTSVRPERDLACHSLSAHPVRSLGSEGLTNECAAEARDSCSAGILQHRWPSNAGETRCLDVEQDTSLRCLPSNWGKLGSRHEPSDYVFRETRAPDIMTRSMQSDEIGSRG